MNKGNYNIILASSSPRRRELLETVLKEFVVNPSHYNEEAPSGMDSNELPVFFANQKARNVYEEYPRSLIIAADTAVICEGRLLGKPGTKKEAREMLTLLSGNIHRVITGVCIMYDDETIEFSNETQVEFYPMTQKEIADYIATQEPMDKAGAYGIQGAAAKFVKKIDGDFYSVMGLPVSALYQKLKAI